MTHFALPSTYFPLLRRALTAMQNPDNIPDDPAMDPASHRRFIGQAVKDLTYRLRMYGHKDHLDLNGDMSNYLSILLATYGANHNTPEEDQVQSLELLNQLNPEVVDIQKGEYHPSGPTDALIICRNYLEYAPSALASGLLKLPSGGPTESVTDAAYAIAQAADLLAPCLRQSPIPPLSILTTEQWVTVINQCSAVVRILYFNNYPGEATTLTRAFSLIAHEVKLTAEHLSGLQPVTAPQMQAADRALKSVASALGQMTLAGQDMTTDPSAGPLLRGLADGNPVAGYLVLLKAVAVLDSYVDSSGVLLPLDSRTAYAAAVALRYCLDTFDRSLIHPNNLSLMEESETVFLALHKDAKRMEEAMYGKTGD